MSRGLRDVRRRAASVVRRPVLVLPIAVVLLVATAHPAFATAAPSPRIDLRVLVVTDGSPGVRAVEQELVRTGVSVTVVDLLDPARPRIDEAFLADEVAGTPRVRHQAVVLPNERPARLAAQELDALHGVERRFGIRQLDAAVLDPTAVGLAAWSDGGYVGWSGGRSAQLTAAALRGEFDYARGRVPLDGGLADDTETWIRMGRPGPDFRPVLAAPVPDVAGTAALAGVLQRDGREEMVLTFDYELDAVPFRVLAPGLVRWLTRGVHLGLQRSWFSVHVDDVLLPNARWVPGSDCASGADCPDDVPARPLIRMTPADVDHAVDWQRRHGFRMDLVFNGAGSVAAAAGGEDPLTTALVAAKDEFGWINHTWSHLYLGCVRDASVTPWRCAEIPILGWTRYVSTARIQEEVERNVAFARQHGLPIDPTELVTGEHGGLRALPQMPDDSPRLAPAITAAGVRTLAADASAEDGPRQVGASTTLPRHPIDLDYDTATVAETVDQYNWLRSSTADGGSGECERDASCIRPLDPATGFATAIVPVEADEALSHVLANDPRPHYVHQPQLAEDRTIYPVLERVLGTYRELFTDRRPIVVPTMTQAREELVAQTEWARAWRAGRVEAWLQDGVVTVRAAGEVQVPLTAPAPLRAGAVPVAGDDYGGEFSSWVPVSSALRLVAAGREPA